MARRQRISVRRITLTLAVLVALSTSLIAIEIVFLRGRDEKSHAQVDLSDRFLITNAILPIVPSIAGFEEVTRRNLFLPDRGGSPATAAPPEPEAEAPPPPSSGPPMTLSAVIMAPSMKLAILQPTTGDATHKAQIGETIEGWRLTAIYPDHVELENAGEIKKLYLGDTIAPEDATGSKNGKNETPSPDQ